MSIEAMIWVRKHAPTKNSAEMCILYALADRANDDGTGCWPYYETLADEARVSLPTVKRHIKNLEERGLIVRGNQALVASYPKYRKPVVWNLNIKLRREVKKPEEKAGDHIDTTPERGISGDKVGYQIEQTEVSVSTDCGVTLDTDNHPLTILQPPSKPSPLTPKGELVDVQELFTHWYSSYPRKQSRGDAEKAFKAAIKKADTDTLIAGLKASIAQWAREQRPLEKVPYPASWLRAESWLDEIPSPVTATASSTGTDWATMALDLNLASEEADNEIPF